LCLISFHVVLPIMNLGPIWYTTHISHMA
jgi:hypothetical protein